MEEVEQSTTTETILTQHEPHPRARSRVLVALAAVAVVVVVSVVWARWGEQIKEACTGKKGACEIELPADPSTAPVDPQFFDEPTTTN